MAQQDSDSKFCLLVCRGAIIISSVATCVCKRAIFLILCRCLRLLICRLPQQESCRCAERRVSAGVRSRWCAAQLPTHTFTLVAAAAFRSATAAADEAQAEVARRREALQSDVLEQPDVARGAIMARAAAALSGPNARAAMVRNPRAAVYHSSLATSLSAGMPRDVALLYAGASQAGVDLGDSLSGDAPNSTIVRRAVRKRLADAAAEKRIAQVARIECRLGSVGGASTSIRV